MKRILVFLSLFCLISAFGQKTIQFSDPQPANQTSVYCVDKQYFGTYQMEDAGPKYIVNETGIFIETVVISFITREQIRESSKYRISGDFLYGILNNGDSVPCVLEGEKYYFGIPQRLTIIDAKSLNSMKKLGTNEYVVNFHEGQYFEPSLFTFSGGKLKVIHPELDFQTSFSSILQVGTITRYGQEVAILAPTFEQWERLYKAMFVGKALEYVK